MKTNSLFKRLVSMLIVVLMICTLFPVTALAWDPPQPDPSLKPAKPTYNDLKSLLEVEIDCDTESEEDEDEDKHPKITYDLLNNTEGSYDSFSVTQSDRFGYQYTVIVYSARYIQAYSDEELNGEKFGPHSPEDDDDISETVILEYKLVNTGSSWKPKWEMKWCLADDEEGKIDFEVVCNGTPTPPTVPADNDLSAIFGNNKAVRVRCTNSEAGHGVESYDLIAGSYVIDNEVGGDAETGYTCDITVKRGKYIDAYNGTYPDHTADENDDESKTITLKYQDDGTWAVKDSSAPVTFNVECGDTSDPINWETGLSVQKVATNTTSGTVVNTVIPGEEITYTITVENKTGTALTNIKVSEPLDLINLDCLEVSPAGQYSMEDGVGVWTIPSLENGAKTTLTIKVQVKDKVPDKTEIKNTATIIAATAGNDSLPGNIRPTGSSDVKVSAPEEPKVPDAPSYDELKGLLNVTINCINTEASHNYKTQTYSLKANPKGTNDSYSIGEVSGNATDGYTCVITVYPTLYVDTYDEQTGATHKLDPDTQVSAPITLKYFNNRWNVDVPAELDAGDDAEKVSAFSVTFNVVCEETPVTTYTVTYKDGVGGKVFKDDVHTVESGATTPAFVGGIPTRPGYVFVGWTPAVSKNVTGNATYTATWRKVKDTTVIEIGGGNSSSSSKEENPNTGAPVFVGVSVGALAAAK